MILYSSFLSMAPFILLAVTAGAFGPWSAERDQKWSYAWLWDVVLVLSVITGGIVSLLVLGDVVGPNEFTQDFVVVAGCVSLALLAEHILSSIRTRYRNGRMPDQIEMMTPGAPEKLTIDLWDTALTFEKGHRIAVHVTSSNSPRIDVNPNTGGNPGKDAKTRVARNTIYMDAPRPSAIQLPILYLPE